MRGEVGEEEKIRGVEEREEEERWGRGRGEDKK